MKRVMITFLGMAFLLFGTECFAVVLSGKVIDVTEGDTLTIKSSRNLLVKVRLKEVDAPQSGQTFGRQARQWVEDLVLGKKIAVKYDSVDRYGRAIGEVILPKGLILNKELLRLGYAWHYRVHFPVDESLRELEYLAWKKKSGLWVDPSALPPWEFRRENDSPSEPPTKFSDVDYDSIFNYGLLGHLETKLFLWPDCRNYPRDNQGFVVFASKQEAKTSGFKMSPHCTAP